MFNDTNLGYQWTEGMALAIPDPEGYTYCEYERLDVISRRSRLIKYFLKVCVVKHLDEDV